VVRKRQKEIGGIIVIDLHTHTLFSDGALIPSELARRAECAGYKAIAMTDHVDHSNIDIVIPGIVRAAKVINRYWGIKVIPGVEITHVPLESYAGLVKRARRKGALIVVGHGESPVEPVLEGTNRAAIEAGVDILAHPGKISSSDAKLAAQKGVYLEITARTGHSGGNRHVFDTAAISGAKLVFNTDAHTPEDLMSQEKIDLVLGELTGSREEIEKILQNSENILKKLKV